MSSPASNRRGRLTLIALFALFVGPIFVAMLMGRFNWVPAATKSKGELLSSKPDLRALTPLRADGSAYQWQPEKRVWRVLVLPTLGYCESQRSECDKVAADLDKVWLLLGKDADEAELLWFGPLPTQLPQGHAWVPMQTDNKLLEALPQSGEAAGVPVYVVDPNGFVVLRYKPGFDPADLRYDLAKLLKLA